MIDDSLFGYTDLEEDAFFGSRKKRKRRKERRKKRRAMRKARPKVIARKQRQKAFKNTITNVYRDIGGATAIGQAVDSLLIPTRADTLETPSDFEISLTPQDEHTPKGAKGVPMGFIVIGGILVLSVVGVIIYKKRQSV